MVPAVEVLLRMVPPCLRRAELGQDYRDLREMIFGDVLLFEHMIKALGDIEAGVNG